MKDGLHLSPSQTDRCTQTYVYVHRHAHLSGHMGHESKLMAVSVYIFALHVCSTLSLCDCYSVTGEMVCIPGVSNDVCINC